MRKIKLFPTVLIILCLLCATACGKEEFVVNRENDEDDLIIEDGFELYQREEPCYSFLYPEGLEINYNSHDGTGIYTGEYRRVPYVLVKKVDEKGMTPQAYFADCDERMLNTFDHVSSTKICEVPVGEKTLYMTRYLCTDSDTELYIERYIELYDSYYVQYTAVSETIGELNTPLYYAILTLRNQNDIYSHGISKKFSYFEHPDLGFTVSIPDCLTVKELTVGYLASNEDAVLLCVDCNQDDAGNPIADREDFLARAAEDDTFIASFIGVSSTEFGAGSEETIHGKSFYRYPMTFSDGTHTFRGEIELADSKNGGCLLVCYGVRESCDYEKTLTELCEKAISSISMEDE